MSTAVLDDTGSQQDRGAAAERQRDEYLGLLQRTRADFENYQHRTRRDLAQERREGRAEFALGLAAGPGQPATGPGRRREAGGSGPAGPGGCHGRVELIEALGRFGIMPLIALNQPFDPEQHEVLLQVPRTDVPPGTIVEVLQPGYRLDERVLRLAKVAVATAPAPEA